MTAHASAAVGAAAATFPGAVVETTGLVRDYPSGDGVIHAVRGVDLSVAAGRAPRRPRPLGERQDDAPQPPRRPRPADGRPGRRRRPRDLVADRGSARRDPPADHRLRLPGVRARAHPDRGRERRGAAPPRPGRARASAIAGSRSCSTSSGWPSGPVTGPTSCRAASSSGSRSPGRSPTGRASSWPTSRPASSTRRRATGSCSLLRSIVRAEGITAIVATHDPMMLDVADRVVELRDGHLLEH